MLAMEEEHGSEDGLFAELAEDGELLISDKAARARLKEILSIWKNSLIP